MKIGNQYFDTENECYIMGILNVTPDSFSDGGKWNSMDKAKKHVADMIREGAAIIDVGGESTRPGHTQITIEEEIQRVVPVIRMIKENFDIPVSVDSYKSAVVEAALRAGADMVNDIWGFKYDKRVADLTAQYQVPCCLMHNRDNTEYKNFLEDMCRDLRDSVEIAKAAGVPDENIILDPGVGFGKTYEQNLRVINHLECLKDMGYPVLLATSRKSVIGRTLDLPADQRVEGTLVTTVMGVEKGASFVRVHDVKLEVAVVLKGGVQGELVQAVVVPAVHIVVELQLEAVPAQSILLRQPQGVVPLGPEAHLVKFLPVDDGGAGDVLLLRRVRDELPPVLYLKVHGVDPAVVKEAVGIPRCGGGAPEAQSLPEAEQPRQD